VADGDPAAQRKPAVHCWHADQPEREYVPARHCVCVGVGEPAAHTKPAVHDVHDDAPANEYVPARHCVCVADGDPAAQMKPAEHCWHADQPASEYLPARHCVFVAVPEPVVGHTHPAVHGEQLRAPLRANVPAAQMNAAGLATVWPAGHA
jgi:hypothetical protein